MVFNKSILQRSIIHLYPLEFHEEEQSTEIPYKIKSNQKLYCKGEELKNNGMTRVIPADENVENVPEPSFKLP